MITVKHYDQIEIKDSDIVDYLRRGKGGKKSKLKPLKDEYKKKIVFLKEQAESLVKPQAMYKVIEKNALPGRECFGEAEFIVFAIVTIGPLLPEKTKKLLEKGNLVDGVILDAIGSAGAETVANLINEEINQEANKIGLEYSERYSPGYCQWNVKDQELIFNQLPGEKIGVSLSDSLLMSPIKSISFAVNFGKQISTSRWENRCKYCDLGDCSYRRG